jgi:hypothetical protein
LIDPSSDGAEINESCPALGRTRDGRPILAYFRKHRLHQAELYLTDVELDPETRCPRPLQGVGSKIADGCLTSPPIFSSDGRWITFVQSDGGNKGLARCIRSGVRVETTMATASQR